MTELLKKDREFQWSTKEDKSFTILKEELCSDNVLKFPDMNQEFILSTDASNDALGAILAQKDGTQERPIAYASRTLNSAERNYSTTEKELLAIVWGVKHFRPYLYGKKFIILTDHQPLKWLFNLKDPNSRLMRWRIALEEYEYEILYKKGSLNCNADALSRNPVLITQINKPGWRKHLKFVSEPSADSFPVHFRRGDNLQLHIVEDAEDSKKPIAVCAEATKFDKDSLNRLLEELLNILVAEGINRIGIDYIKLESLASITRKEIKETLTKLFNDPLMEVGTEYTSIPHPRKRRRETENTGREP